MKNLNFSKHYCSASTMLCTYWKNRGYLVLLFLLLPFLFFAQPIFAPGCGTTDNPDSGVNNHSASCNFDLTDFNTYHTDDMVPEGITRTLKIKTNVVLLQRENVEPDDLGNFSPSTNSEHKEFLDGIFEKLNAKLKDLQEENCNCTDSKYYNNINIEFVPTFVEIESEYYWNHLNDPQPTRWNSKDKTFLKGIHQKLIEEGYEPGFDVYITTNKSFHDGYIMQNMPFDPSAYPDPYGGNWYSALASTNLEQTAYWHCPDLFLEWYYNRYSTGEDWSWYVGQYKKFASGGFLHEFTHSFLPTIGHQNSCDNNIMNGSGNVTDHPRNSYSGCQVREIYRALMAKHVRKYVTCEDVLDSSHELVIDSDEEWDNNLRLYTNVRVKSEATLTVSCSLFLQPQAKITVERGARLIIAEDAFISNGGVCEDEPAFLWDGVHLHGNVNVPHKLQYAFDWYNMTADDHGIVLMHPNSTIQDAQTAIDCLADEEGFTNSDVYIRKGGYVRAKGANFIENTKGINFTYSIYDNRSEVLDCIFEGGDYGIANRKADGVKVKTCEFNDQEINGIYATDAGMEVHQNAFNRIDEAIAINNLLLLNDPFTVSRNEFVGNGVGVKASLASNLLVANNDFSLGKFGVSLMGQGQAVIQNNKFYDLSAGVDLQSAGEDYIPVGCNTFEMCSTGMNPSGNNIGLQYDRNQNLDGVIIDAFIESDGDGNPAMLRNQGSEIEPRVNAFSISHTNHLFTKDNANELFRYFVEADSPDAVFVPQCSQGDTDCADPFNFELEFDLATGPISFEICGDIGTVFTPEPPNPPCNGCGLSEVLFFGEGDKAALAAAINTKIVSGTIGFTVKDEDLQKDFNALLQYYIFNKDYVGLSNYLENFGDYFLPIQQSISMHEKEYVLAEEQLDQILTYAGYESFVLAQKTYLQWIQDPAYRPDSEDLNLLHTYASQDNPMAAFSRSILSLLYQEVYSPSLPLISGIERKGKVEKSIAIEHWVYPNPVEESLFIEGEKIDSGSTIQIINALGQVIWTKTITQPNDIIINTTKWGKGIYFVELVNTQQERYLEKVVKH